MTCEDLVHSDCQACHANSESCNVRLALNLYNESGISQTFIIIINLALRLRLSGVTAHSVAGDRGNRTRFSREPTLTTLISLPQRPLGTMTTSNGLVNPQPR